MRSVPSGSSAGVLSSTVSKAHWTIIGSRNILDSHVATQPSGWSLVSQIRHHAGEQCSYLKLLNVTSTIVVWSFSKHHTCLIILWMGTSRLPYQTWRRLMNRPHHHSHAPCVPGQPHEHCRLPSHCVTKSLVRMHGEGTNLDQREPHIMAHTAAVDECARQMCKSRMVHCWEETPLYRGELQ